MHSELNLREDWKKKKVHFHTIKMHSHPFYYDDYQERTFQLGLVYIAGLSFRVFRLIDWVFGGYFIN